MERPDARVQRSTWGLMFSFRQLGLVSRYRIFDFTVEMTDVADNRLVFHLLHVAAGNDMITPRGCDENIADCGCILHGNHFVTFHGGLQCAYRIDFRDQDPGAITAHGMGASFAHVAIAAYNHNLAGHHDIGGALDAVGQRFPAAVKIIELDLVTESFTLKAGKSSVPLF